LISFLPRSGFVQQFAGVDSKVNWGHIVICDLIHPNSLHLSLTYRINGDKGIKSFFDTFKRISLKKRPELNPRLYVDVGFISQ